MRDFGAGRCMGACLEYAARRKQPLMLYVFSDGSLSSNGMIDNSAAGRGKGVWTGDNQSTAAAFFLVYNPKGPITAISNQIGYYNADGSVASGGSPGANAVNLLAEMVVLNYLALHGKEGSFQTHAMGHRRDYRSGEPGYLQQPDRHASDRLGPWLGPDGPPVAAHARSLADVKVLSLPERR